MMKDIFVGQLKDVHALNKDKTVSNGQIIAYRSGNKVELQNLNENPSVHMSYNQMTSELIIRIPLNDGDYIVVQDKQGIAKKGVLE